MYWNQTPKNVLNITSDSLFQFIFLKAEIVPLETLLTKIYSDTSWNESYQIAPLYKVRIIQL